MLGTQKICLKVTLVLIALIALPYVVETMNFLFSLAEVLREMGMESTQKALGDLRSPNAKEKTLSYVPYLLPIFALIPFLIFYLFVTKMVYCWILSSKRKS